MDDRLASDRAARYRFFNLVLLLISDRLCLGILFFDDIFLEVELRLRAGTQFDAMSEHTEVNLVIISEVLRPRNSLDQSYPCSSSERAFQLMVSSKKFRELKLFVSWSRGSSWSSVLDSAASYTAEKFMR